MLYRATAYAVNHPNQDAHHSHEAAVKWWAQARVAEGYTVIVERKVNGINGVKDNWCTVEILHPID